MSHFHAPFQYNLYKLSQRQCAARYELISRLAEVNPNLACLSQLNSPTNNHQKYTNKILGDFITQLTFGDFNSEEIQPVIKQLYLDFIKDYEIGYQYLCQQYLEQQQEQQRQAVRLYEEQLRYIQQNGSKFSASQPVSFGGDNPYYQQEQFTQGYHNQPQQGYFYQQQYAQQQQQQQYNQQQQQYSQQQNFDGRRNTRQNYNRDQPQQGYARHQNRESHYNREQRDFNQPHHAGPKRKQFHEKHDFTQDETQTELMEAEIPAVLPAEPQVQKVAEPVVEVIIEEPKVVPKPVPQPRKFTIDEIKKFIDSVSIQELQENANPQVVAKAKEISGWATQQIQVETKDDPKFNRKDSKPQHNNNRDRGGRDDNKQGIKTGVKRDEAKEAERMGYKQEKESSVVIVIGAKETLGTRQIKEDIKKKAGQDFATLKEKEYENMDQVQKSRKQIIYNLNLIVPQNLNDIEKDLVGYLFKDAYVCKILIEEIIKKAWDQPKYASTYAKLCYNFSKRSASEFSFEGNKREGKKDNPFKFFLIERVQHSFDQKIEKFREFGSEEDKDNFFKETKKKIISNVKFIAELILFKILKKKTMKYCISQLFKSFLHHYYAFAHDKQIQDSTYDFYFQAIIEFIQNIGEVYDTVQEKQKDKEKDQQQLKRIYNRVEDHVEAILHIKQPPNLQILNNMEAFTADQYFDLLGFINNTFIKKNFPRLSALLQNLVQRRNNKWQKHLSAADGPKKLREIQEDIGRQEDEQSKSKSHLPTQEQKDKAEQEKLDKKVKELFEGWEMDKHEQLRELKDILRKHSERQFYISFLKQVADEKKDNVIKRVALFPVIIKQHFNSHDFRSAWLDSIKYLAIGSGDYPYCGAALAKVLQAVLDKEGRLQDHFQKFEDEDEEYFMEEVIQKYYYYSQNEAALKYVKPKNKYSGLI